MLLRLVGRYDESNRAFDASDRISEDLYTRSISREAAALAVSDRLAPYRPAPYERLLARVYQARNYLDADDPSGGLVEARRIEQLLDEQEDADSTRAGSSDYVLATLTAALAFEAGDEPEDALRMYRRLVEGARRGGTQTVPPWVEGRLRALARTTGFDLTGVLDAGGEGDLGDSLAETVVLFIDHGLVPQRQEMRLDLPILKDEENDDPKAIAPRLYDRAHRCRTGNAEFREPEIAYWLSVALPFYAPDPPPTPIAVDGADGMMNMLPTADLAAAAREALDRQMPEIILRTGLRALIKYGAQSEARNHGGKVGGALVNVLGAATEWAETRSWSTLPHDITLVVLDLPRQFRLPGPEQGIGIRWVRDDGTEAVDFLPLPRPGGGHLHFLSCRIWS